MLYYCSIDHHIEALSVRLTETLMGEWLKGQLDIQFT